MKRYIKSDKNLDNNDFSNIFQDELLKVIKSYLKNHPPDKTLLNLDYNEINKNTSYSFNELYQLSARNIVLSKQGKCLYAVEVYFDEGLSEDYSIDYSIILYTNIWDDDYTEDLCEYIETKTEKYFQKYGYWITMNPGTANIEGELQQIQKDYYLVTLQNNDNSTYDNLVLAEDEDSIYKYYNNNKIVEINTEVTDAIYKECQNNHVPIVEI